MSISNILSNKFQLFFVEFTHKEINDCVDAIGCAAESSSFGPLILLLKNTAVAKDYIEKLIAGFISQNSDKHLSLLTAIVCLADNESYDKMITSISQLPVSSFKVSVSVATSYLINLDNRNEDDTTVC